MITLEHYFAKVEDLRNPQSEGMASQLLEKVNALLDYMEKEHGVKRRIDKETGCEISGDGSGGGGARRKDSKEGRPLSSHKEFKGIDITDPLNELDGKLTDAILLKFRLYREHHDYTKGWCHLTTRPPGSGKRTFIP